MGSNNSKKDNFLEWFGLVRQAKFNAAMARLRLLKSEKQDKERLLEEERVKSRKALEHGRVRRKKIKLQNQNRLFKLKQYLWETYGMLEFAPAKQRQSFNEAVVPPAINVDMASIKNEFTKKVQHINNTELAKPEEERNLIHISAEQEKMLFSSNTATNIIAGAGSGKSTTLILRIIMMHKIMDIGLNKITVCTFTKESRKDFIKSLQLRFKQFGTDISHPQAKNIVRTFHSLAYEIHKRLGDTSKSILFDYESQRPGDDDPYGENLENQMQPLDKRDLDSLDEPSRKLEMMMGVYKRVYSNDPDFRAKTIALYKASLLKERDALKDNHKAYGWIAEYVDELSDFCLSDWISKFPHLTKQIEKYRVNDTHETVEGIDFKYNLYLRKSNIKVFLSIKNVELKDRKVLLGGPDKQLASYVEYYRRYALLRASCYLIYRPEELLRLIAIEEYELSEYQDTLPIPDFTYTCQGDIPPSSGGQIKDGLLVTQFEKIIDFSYAINKPLYSITDKQVSVFSNPKTEVPFGDSLFLQLARLFHIAWIQHLDAANLTTFDEIFYQFGSPTHPVYKQFDHQSLSKLQHLMMDEFQDISPLISRCFNQLKKQLNMQQVVKNGSIMSVGDDCQSIYGWRGSAPSFILDYKSCFDLAHDESEYPLENNYRCAKKILDLGSKIIEKIPKQNRKVKRIFAKGPNAHAEDALVSLHKPIRTGEKESVNFELAAQKLEEEANQPGISEKNPIYLLCTKRSLFSKKSNAKWYETIKRLKRQKLLKVLTVHSAKGLEAYTVLVVGDAREPNPHPLRETLCRLSDVPIQYNEGQREEQLRLAYVAVTRAKNRLYWFAESLDTKKNILSDLFKEE
ncbi:hypothetical protein CWC05_18280 [Pseudoalteromonas ruthenica]|uniref:DNA 3'-5' helicase n=1 Tax=Pseudoalteromonas ruthenica TaxID=151081 RepID=A0A5S3YZN9_9GAMM|nr:UvrD-helicase domain-containing protein [Pseudoalteromonas ruthenica]TMP85489.1 hypothetical protein CWC05_18280 [Pseudoalteromonas ruthenica]